MIRRQRSQRSLLLADAVLGQGLVLHQVWRNYHNDSYSWLIRFTFPLSIETPGGSLEGEMGNWTLKSTSKQGIWHLLRVYYTSNLKVRYILAHLSSNLYLHGSAISHTFVFLHASPLEENIFSMWVSVWGRIAFYLPLIVNCPRIWLPSTKCLELAMESALASVFLARDFTDCQGVQGHSGVLDQWDLPLLHLTWDKYFV